MQEEMMANENIKITIDIEEYQESFEFYGFKKCTNAHFSHLFVGQLIGYGKLRLIDPFIVAQEILAMEGIRGKSLTKPATKFTKGKIKGYWHKHFFDAHHLGVNIAQHFAKGDVTKGKASYPGLDRVINRIMDSTKSDIITQEMTNELAHTVSVSAYEERAKAEKLTGDWIIYVKHKEQNYYLAIASHSQDTDELYEFIKKHCMPQFPFLFDDSHSSI